MRCCGKGYCFKKAGWIYLHIEGDPYERGFQHGYLMANEMQQALTAIKYYVYFTTGMEFQFFTANADRMFRPFLKKSEFEEELRGISAGAQKAGASVTLEEVVCWNGFLELYDFWWPWKQRHSSSTKAIINRCSAFVATGDATKSKSIVIGHNSWADFIFGQNFNVIADINPSDGLRILMQTMPGYIVSMSDFMVSSGGLVITETTIQIRDYKEDGKPEFLRAREAVQYARTINEWVKIMKQDNNGGVANSWLLGDLKSNQIARYEQGMKYDNLLIKTNGMFTGFNAPEDPRIRNLECNQSNYYSDIRSEIGSRRVRWRQLEEEYYGAIDVSVAKKMLSDHHDVYLNTYNPCTRTICGHTDNDCGDFPSTSSPYSLQGALDGKVLDAGMGKKMQFEARWGRPCGTPFYGKEHFKNHPQWDWQQVYIKDMLTQPWTLFKTQMSAN